MPDELSAASLDGERLVARLRVVLFVCLAGVPPIIASLNRSDPRLRIIVPASILGVVISIGIHEVVKRSRDVGRIGVLSSMWDVSLVTMTLLGIFHVVGHFFAVHNPVVYPLYLVFIGTTALRYDYRICVAAGLTAFVQYAGILLLAAQQTGDASRVSAAYPLALFDPAVVVGRLLLIAIATALAASVIWRARQLVQLSIRDGLTGLVNRSFWDERLREAWESHKRGHVFAIGFLDLDHFKKINDVHGHEVGDRVLKAAATYLLSSFRGSDTVARWGGEEFAILAIDAENPKILERFDRMRSGISELIIETYTDGQTIHVTASVGVAWSSEVASLDELCALGDQRLYEAKHQGRNRSVGLSKFPEAA